MNKKTLVVNVGGIGIGGNNPVRIQSMTNTKTSKIEDTVKQIIELYDSGSELVRITVNDEQAAKAVPLIINTLKKQGINIPIIGDFHFNGHILLEKYPDMSQALAKYRINPGNVGTGNKKDDNFRKIIECAIKYNKPVRIGVNSGSVDEKLLKKYDKGEFNKKVLIDTMIESAIISTKQAKEYGLSEDKIILSVKMSDVQNMIKAYEILSSKVKYPLHLGLTEAGGATKGIVSSSVALGILLNQGIGNTIRVSITPEPGSRRSLEVEVCKHLLQSMGLRFFQPQIISCPGCGRTSSDKFQILSKQISDEIEKKMPIWKQKFQNFENTSIAIMGCIVNGPGESKHADIGISLPGDYENPQMPVYIKGELYKNLSGNNVFNEFIEIIEEHFYRHNKKDK